MVAVIAQQRGSGKVAVISLLIIIGLSVAGVITALTGGFGDKSDSALANPASTEVRDSP